MALRFMRRLPLPTAFFSLALVAPALALPSCGSLDQPVCVEAKPPGVTLTLKASENPFGLQPLRTTRGSTTALWPKHNGHKPYGFNAATPGMPAATTASITRQMGGSMVRLSADWSLIQYYPNTSQGGKPWNYAQWLDGQYKAYVARGVRPLLTIMRTPRRFTVHALTSGKGKDVRGCGTSDSCWNPPRGEEASRLATFARDLAKRYPLAAGIEFWNEPNLSHFWGREQLDPEYYAQLLGIVHDAVKAVNPSLPVLGGALANAGTDGLDDNGQEQMSMRTFLRGMLESGAQADMDAVSYHPYLGPYPTWEPTATAQKNWLNKQLYQAQQWVVEAYAAAGKTVQERLVPTEFGASTTDGWTEAKQRDWLVWQFRLWDADYAAMPLADRVDAAFVHMPADNPNPAWGNAWQSGFGLLQTPDAAGRYPTKPVFCGFRAQFGGMSSCPERITP